MNEALRLLGLIKCYGFYATWESLTFKLSSSTVDDSSIGDS